MRSHASVAVRSESLRGFRVRDLPREHAVIRSIAARTDFERACAGVKPSRGTAGLIELALPEALLRRLRSAAREAIELHGLHGWLSSDGRETGGSYRSLSLTYNPDLKDPGVTDVHQSTLGTSVNRPSEFYYGSVQRFAALKNTYFDTYGFRLPTPAAGVGALGEFLSGFRLSPVRSRLSALMGAQTGTASFSTGWHRDEPVFENLRINIPLVSHRHYRLQIEHARDRPEERSDSMSDHFLAPGKAYTFDTHLPHRVYGRAPRTVDRIHLVLGFSPWFRYDRTTDSWAPNEFYGRVHPFDIARSGALHPALRSV